MNAPIELNDDQPSKATGDSPIEISEAAHDEYRLQIEQLQADNERLEAENKRLAAENAGLLSHLSEQSAVAATQAFLDSSQGLMFEEHTIEEAMLSPTVTNPDLTATVSLPPSSTSTLDPCPASTTPCEHWQLSSAYGDLYCIERSWSSPGRLARLEAYLPSSIASSSGWRQKVRSYARRFEQERSVLSYQAHGRSMVNNIVWTIYEEPQ